MAEKTGIRRAATAAAAVLVGWSVLRRNSVLAGGDETAAAADKQDGRGRDAHRATAIPLAGWKDILWRTYAQVSKNRVLLVAAGVTFYALLALFPALTALVSIYGIFADPQTVVDHVEATSDFIPEGAVDIIAGQMASLDSPRVN